MVRLPNLQDEGDRAGDGREEPAQPALSLAQLSESFAQLLGAGAEAPPVACAPGMEGVLPVAAEPGLTESSPRQADEAAAAETAEVTPLGIVEAMLFVGSPDNAPLTAEQAASVMRGVEPGEVHALVRELNERYRTARCPYEIVSEGAGYRLVLREEFHRLRDRFYGRVRQARLSQAAIEVLALVAYNEPLSGEEVSRLRGVPSGGILSQLVRRQLLRLERPEEQPRAPVYYTTERFLELFRLERREDLPQSEDIDQR